MNDRKPCYENPEQQLVSNILQQAVADIWLHPHNADSSLGFFLNEEYCFGSFLWCCDTLDICPGAIMRKLRVRIAECVELSTSLPRVPRKKLTTTKLLAMMRSGELKEKKQ